MANTDALGLDGPIELPHEFETDLGLFVVENHRLTLEGIDRAEEKGLEELGRDLSKEDPEVVRSMENWLQNYYDDLRRAANNQAAVALVTRLQHWISRLARKSPGSRSATNRSWSASSSISTGIWAKALSP